MSEKKSTQPQMLIDNERAFIPVKDWAFNQSSLGPAEKMALIAIVFNADESFEVSGAQMPTLVRQSELSPSRFQGAIVTLVEHGLIERLPHNALRLCFTGEAL